MGVRIKIGYFLEDRGHEIFIKAIVSRLAVETGFWFLYEVDHGSLEITYQPPKYRPVIEYIKLQGRFQGFTEESIQMLQKWVDERREDLGV